MNIVVEILGAILSRVSGWLVLTLAVWVLRLAGKGLGAAAQPVLTLMRVRRTEPPVVAAAGVPGPPATTPTCPHCGVATPPDPFCAACGRALPAA
jgi:hypothetical protein